METRPHVQTGGSAALQCASLHTCPPCVSLTALLLCLTHKAALKLFVVSPSPFLPSGVFIPDKHHPLATHFFILVISKPGLGVSLFNYSKSN